MWTLKTEGHTRIVTLTAEGMNQTAHLYYWIWVTTVFLDDLNGTSSVCVVLCPEKCPKSLQFSCLEKKITVPSHAFSRIMSTDIWLLALLASQLCVKDCTELTCKHLASNN